MTFFRQLLFGYARVSNADQNPDQQIDRCSAPPSRRDDIYIDHASGAKASRPELDNLLRLLREALPVAQPRGFIAQTPTRDAALRLRLRRHQDPNARWESNDMVDIAYLACAVVHCDVVVTEKQWVHELRGSGLLDDHRARALADVGKLPEVLVETVT